eukprot:1442756-Prymnesium_polylepis.1
MRMLTPNSAHNRCGEGGNTPVRPVVGCSGARHAPGIGPGGLAVYGICQERAPRIGVGEGGCRGGRRGANTCP